MLLSFKRFLRSLASTTTIQLALLLRRNSIQQFKIAENFPLLLIALLVLVDDDDEVVL